jgi:hypothetical protein
MDKRLIQRKNQHFQGYKHTYLFQCQHQSLDLYNNKVRDLENNRMGIHTNFQSKPNTIHKQHNKAHYNSYKIMQRRHDAHHSKWLKTIVLVGPMRYTTMNDHRQNL